MILCSKHHNVLNWVDRERTRYTKYMWNTQTVNPRVQRIQGNILRHPHFTIQLDNTINPYTRIFQEKRCLMCYAPYTTTIWNHVSRKWKTLAEHITVPQGRLGVTKAIPYTIKRMVVENKGGFAALSDIVSHRLVFFIRSLLSGWNLFQMHLYQKWKSGSEVLAYMQPLVDALTISTRDIQNNECFTVL